MVPANHARVYLIRSRVMKTVVLFLSKYLIYLPQSLVFFSFSFLFENKFCKEFEFEFELEFCEN